MGAPVQGPNGPQFRTIRCRAINRTGSTLTRGAVVQFDTTLSSEATGYFSDVGSAASLALDGFANVVLPTSANNGIHAVLDQPNDCDDDDEGLFLIEGFAYAKVLADSGGTPSTAVSPGIALAVDAGEDHLVAATGSTGPSSNDGKTVGLLAVSLTDETVEELGYVLFAGFSGLGIP